MNNNDEILIKKFAINCEQKTIYHYKKFQYGKLQNALNYAKRDKDHSDVNTEEFEQDSYIRKYE